MDERRIPPAAAAIPIVIAVTGHRRIAGDARARIEREVSQIFQEFSRRYPHTPLLLLTQLAEGADTLCAQAALRQGIPFGAVLPMDAPAYREGFDGLAAPVFDALLRKAAFACGPGERFETNGEHYLAAGKYMLRRCHLLLALWDGVAENPLPGGTADIVRLARAGRFGKDGSFGAEDSLPVIHIVTPRDGARGAGTGRPAPGEGSGAVSLLPELPLFRDIENFNAAAAAASASKKDTPAQGALPQGPGAGYRLPDPALVCAAADALAQSFQTKRARAIFLLSLIGLFFVSFFLLYDEAAMLVMLFAYGAILIPAYLLLARSKKGKWHERYTLYRTLAEAMRVRSFMNIAGIEECARIPAWQRDRGLDFVQGALTAFSAVPGGAAGVSEPRAEAYRQATRLWVDGQLAYHQNAKRLRETKLLHDRGWTRILIALAAVVYAATIVCELFFHEALSQTLIGISAGPLSPDAGITGGSLFKIALGLLFAGIAFLSNYYGKQALGEQIASSEKMERLFSRAKRELDGAAPGAGYEETAESVFRELAEAHLGETASWYLFAESAAPELIFG
jgi:hypothetical protein